MTELTVRGRPFPPGISGNPSGRPLGSRTAFSQAFMHDLAVSWSKDGAKVLERVAKENPAGYFSVCARLLPSDVAVTITAQAPILDASDLQILRAIKQAIPSAGDQQPDQVLQYVFDAVRAYESSRAKLIDVNSKEQR